ncbi:glycosyltransferase [Corynebacterium coyleae]|uniref:glycosyltransferase n=1 Tax=Corynebacterium coyleae TaxID=53374 RepID=UPI002550F97D|nr:glycosyltransferase [Corynebacterium coyleae]MDK8800609.1 glycosyltransferase [Corynebacterium coyleae]
MKFIGHTRYSMFMPNSTAWKASNGSRFRSVEDYREYLYSDQRMQLREDIFLKESLPALERAAEGHELRHIVSFSSSLPNHRKLALQKAADEYPFVVLDEVPDGSRPSNRYEVVGDFLSKGTIFGDYRLDDDDVLPVSFFDRMSQYLTPTHVGYVISFPLGIEAILADGSAFNLREAHYPMNSVGQLGVCKMNIDGSIQMPSPSSHTQVDRHNPTVLDSRQIGYFRYNHTGQDNAMNASGDADLSRLVSSMQHFPVLSPAFDLEAAFPFVMHRIAKPKEKELEFHLDPFSQVDFPQKAQCFELVLDCTFPEGTKPNDYLLSFDLVDDAGRPLAPGRMGVGLSASPNPGVGYFRYIRTGAGRTTLRESVFLMNGVSAEAVTLVQWQRKDTVQIHNAKLNLIK